MGSWSKIKTDKGFMSNNSGDYFGLPVRNFPGTGRVVRVMPVNETLAVDPTE
jgi:hypothetical protein